MHPRTTALLRSLSSQQAAERLAAGTAWEPTGLVLVDALGRGVSPDTYGNRFRVLCAEAQVPTIPMHNVRHTVALMLHRAGEAPADVASLLGHTVSTPLAHLRAQDRAGRGDCCGSLRRGPGSGPLSRCQERT